MHDDLLEYRGMFDEIEANVLRRVGLTRGRVSAIVAALVTMVAGLSMTQAGQASGWETLVNSAAAQSEATGILATAAVHACVVFGVVCSSVALCHRSFPTVVVSSMGCGLTSIVAFLAVWERQSRASAQVAGVGHGSVVLLTCAIVLTALWTGAALRGARPSTPTSSLPNI